MVSPGTHVVKNNESQSRTNESQLKKTNNSKLGLNVTMQTVNLTPKLCIAVY